MADYDDGPPPLPAETPRVKEGGKPTLVALEWEHYQAAWFARTVTDLSTRLTEVRSDTDDNAAAITLEQATRTSEDEALAEQIITVQANVDDVSATVEDVITAYTDADTALAADITTLTTTVGGYSASISTLTASVNGLEVRYGVEGSINGSTGGFTISGVGQLDGSASFSLEFLLSNFALTDPNIPGGTGNVFNYNGSVGAFQFGIPVMFSSEQVIPGALNNFLPVSFAPGVLQSGVASVAAVITGSSVTITTDTKSAVLVTGTLNIVAGAPTFGHPIGIAVVYRLDGVGQFTVIPSQTFSGGPNNSSWTFTEAIEIATPGSHTLDLYYTYVSAYVDGVFAVASSRYSAFIFQGVA